MSSLGIQEPKNYDGEVTGTVTMTSKKRVARVLRPLAGGDDNDNESHNNNNDNNNNSVINNANNSTATEQGTENYEEDEDEDDGMSLLKKTDTGIILNPQPQDDPNDPLNWPVWRRDLALAVIGFHSFICGGMTPLLAAAFTKLSVEFDVSQSTLAYLVGPFMLAMGVGSVILAPTALLYGKRLVYMTSALIFLLACVWGGASNSFGSLVGARILMGIGCSPAESLPSASIAEIYFLHERAYRLGIYTLLLLGGKNLIPLVAGFVVESLSWKWLFWILTIIVGFNFIMEFFFVPETWWDRTPIPNKRSLIETERAREARAMSLLSRNSSTRAPSVDADTSHLDGVTNDKDAPSSSSFHLEKEEQKEKEASQQHGLGSSPPLASINVEQNDNTSTVDESKEKDNAQINRPTMKRAMFSGHVDRFILSSNPDAELSHGDLRDMQATYMRPHVFRQPSAAVVPTSAKTKKTYKDSLQIYYGRFTEDSWWMVALRPFVLYAYPGVLFSTAVYSFSVVWLIMISETVSKIFSAEPYNFPTESVGLLYIGTFVGGCLGSAIAGMLSDILVRFMSRRNGGVYEPEFRLLLIVPVMIAISIGMMGFGWSAYEKDAWIVPAIFLGIIGFGCSLGSTTAITYAVDSYKMFAAEALVTLNFTKNLFGFLFSLFVPKFLAARGSKDLFVTFGGLEIFICLWAIPLYIYGKRLRHWTDEKQMMRFLYKTPSESHADEPSTDPDASIRS